MNIIRAKKKDKRRIKTTSESVFPIQKAFQPQKNRRVALLQGLPKKGFPFKSRTLTKKAETFMCS